MDFIELSNERAQTIADHLVGFIDDNNVNSEFLCGKLTLTIWIPRSLL